jgi:membrane protease YdiL (CAAX protease family)
MVNRKSLIIFVIGFFALWTAAWLLHQLYVWQLHWWSADQSGVDLAYWVTMKFLVWIVYPALFWRRKVSSIRDFIGLSPTKIKSGYKWGVVATVVWVGLLLAINLITKKSFIGVDNWATYIYVITLTPIMEEIMFRGFILSGLLAVGMKGKLTNVMTTALFLLVHMLGWAFQGALIHNLTSTAWISIALFSLVAGFIRIHSGSLRASILLHMGNNAWAGLLG